MTIWQAILIGIFAYLGRNQVPWLFGTTGGWYGIGRPLVAGMIVGAIMGDVKTGIMCGVAVQAIFIGQITPGGAVPSDMNLAAYCGIPLAMAAGGDPETAIALSIPLGTLGVGLHNFTMTFNSYFSHRADKYAENCDIKGIARMNILGTLPSLLERFTIVTLVCYFGAPFAERLLSSLPEFVLRFLQVGGKMLPALGFALLLKQILAEGWMIVLFLFGWILMTTIGMTTTSLVLIAVAIALLFVMGKGNGVGAATAAIIDEEDEYDE